MTLFNKSDLIRRARNRLARRAAHDQAQASAQHAREYLAIMGMEKVVNWASQRGLSVHIHSKVESGRYEENCRRVDISSRLNPEKQLAILLHELGHYLIGSDNGKTARARFPNGYRRIDDGEPGRDALHKIDVIAEEFEAWHRGWKLGERLKIVIDREHFDIVRSEYLKSYFKWALKRGRVSDGE